MYILLVSAWGEVALMISGLGHTHLQRTSECAAPWSPATPAPSTSTANIGAMVSMVSAGLGWSPLTTPGLSHSVAMAGGGRWQQQLGLSHEAVETVLRKAWGKDQHFLFLF